MDSWCKLDEEQLPSKEKFYSRLTESHISDEEYEYARLVWSAFDVKTLGGYSDLYMQTDVLLLADLFENFRETCHKIYGLDPAHYIIPVFRLMQCSSIPKLRLNCSQISICCFSSKEAFVAV